MQKIPDVKCVYIDKDVIAGTLLGKEQYFTKYYDEYVHHQSYQLMISLTRDHLKINNVIILDGIFGDKINEYVMGLLGSDEFDVKLIHFHCSGNKQFNRLKSRGYQRDVRHLAEFTEYRHIQIKNHLLGLSQTSQYCVIDTENDEDMGANIQQILRYLESPCTVQLFRQIDKNISIPSTKEAMEGAANFVKLLDKAKQSPKYHHLFFGMPSDEKEEQESNSRPLQASL